MLQQELKTFIKKNGMRKASLLSGLSDQTLWNVLKGQRPTKKTVDILYKLLKLPIDDWYISNLKNWYSDNEGVGMLIRTIRVNMGMNQEEFSKMIDVNPRTLQRIETQNHIPKKAVCSIISSKLTEFFKNNR